MSDGAERETDHGGMTRAYAGQTLALLTQHGKERVIAPVLEPALGCVVARVEGFDTDTLGTFTRETPRPGTQLEAARRKARIAMALSGLRVGLASEGSFGADPVGGLLPWNLELLVLIDDRLGLEIVGRAQGPGGGLHLLTRDRAELAAFAARAGFPAQGLVLRPGHEDDPRIRKDLADAAQLHEAFEACAAQAPDGRVFVEADLRAFANPSRMQRIGEAAQDLLQRIASTCPACGLPGFAVVERERGLRCEDCGWPTRQHRSEAWQCAGCGHRVVVPRADRLRAEARHCDICNP